MKCQRCEAGESVYKVKSSILDISVCSWCARVAQLINELGPSGRDDTLHISRQMDLVLAVSGGQPTTILICHA